MSAITLDGDLVHYEVLGRGKKVILLHGWLGSWRYWIPTMRLLQLRYRVYALDLFGFGDSGKNPARYPIIAQVDMLDRFMIELGIDKTAIIAHGLGAQIAVEYAQHFPEKVARMLLVSAPLFDPGDLRTRVPEGSKNYLTGHPHVKPTVRPPLASKGDRPVIGPNDATIPSAGNQTMGPGNIDREKLRRAAMQVGAQAMMDQDPIGRRSLPKAEPLRLDPNNPLYQVLQGGMNGLLSMCFRRSSDEGYEAVQPDMARTDQDVLKYSAAAYDAGKMLDAMRQLDIPMVVVHGEDDPVIPAPSDAVWDYLTLDHDSTIVPFPLPNVKHFPMLEVESFMRLLGLFLETPNVADIELKERWRRRTH